MRTSVLGVLVLLLGGAIAQAQDAILLSTDTPEGFGQMGPAGSPVSLLLRLGDVHRELGIDAEQRFQLSRRMSEAARNRRVFFEDLVAGKVFNEPIDATEKRSLLDLYNRDGEQTILQALNLTQVERLTQISLQLQGVEALRKEKIAAALQLSDEQRSEIRTRLREHASKREVADVLTERQHAEWRQMLGTPFAFTSLRKRIELTAKSDAEVLAKRNRRVSSPKLAFD